METQTEYLIGKTKYIKNPNSNLYYAEGTNEKVIKALERARINDWRVVIDFGNTETGVSWNEVYDTTGYIGNSIGPCKVPILIYNKRSTGGGAISTRSILSIRRTGKNGEYLYKWGE